MTYGGGAGGVPMHGRLGLASMQSDYGTHALRRTNASVTESATGKLRAGQILPGHSKIENTVRHFGIDGEHAFAPF